MELSWKALLMSSLALGVQADDPSDLGELIKIAAAHLMGGSVGVFVGTENQTGLGDILTPMREIHLDDIIPTLDSAGNSRCCPPGTINDGSSCVFPESSVCPPGSRLEGNVCVSTPRCPGALIFDGVHCSDIRGPQCPKETYRDGNLCVSESAPRCIDTSFNFKEGKCVSYRDPTCPTEYDFSEGKCWSRVLPICTGRNLAFERGVCIDPKGPTCPEGSNPSRDGRCIGIEPPACDEDYEPVEGVCRHKGNIYCEGDGVLNGDNCETKETPTCPEGKPDGETCVKDALCDTEHGYILVNDMCTKITPASCSGGRTISKDPDSGKYMCCPEGTSFDGEGCRAQKDESGNCPRGSKEVDGWCRYPPQNAECPQPMELKGCKCEARTHPECADGTLYGGKCILEHKPRCPKNSQQVGNRCILNARPKCPGDSQLFNGKCLGDDPTCPDKFRLENNECISNQNPVCKDGFHYHDGLCRHPTDPICKSPTYLFKGKCIWPENPTCERGERFENGECVSKDLPKCDGNFRLVDGKCVRTDGGPECVKPLQRVGDKCIIVGGARCPENHRRVGNECISDKDPRCEGTLRFDSASGKCVSPDGPKCPDGTDIVNGRCESPKIPVCPPEHDMGDDGKCVSEKQPNCPEGSKLQEGKCVLEVKPGCPEGTDPVGNQCIAKKGPKCPDNLVPSGTACISTDQPSCGHNMAFDPTTGKCIVATKKECFNMEVCPAAGAPSLPSP